MKETHQKQQICTFIQTFSQEHGYPPTVREIGKSLGMRSPSTVKFHLDKLRADGLLQWEDGKPRSLVLTRTGEASPLPHPNGAHLPACTWTEGQVPLVGNVAAGTPIWAEECVEEYISFPGEPRSEGLFALRVRGESMLMAGILPGDMVVVRPQIEPHNGDIVVALFEDEATVKTYSHKNDHIWLLPQNPNYTPIDGTNAQIVGKVVGVVRRY